MTEQNYFVLNGTVKKVLALQTQRDKITVTYPSDEEALFRGFNVSLCKIKLLNLCFKAVAHSIPKNNCLSILTLTISKKQEYQNSHSNLAVQLQSLLQPLHRHQTQILLQKFKSSTKDLSTLKNSQENSQKKSSPLGKLLQTCSRLWHTEITTKYSSSKKPSSNSRKKAQHTFTA